MAKHIKHPSSEHCADRKRSWWLDQDLKLFKRAVAAIQSDSTWDGPRQESGWEEDSRNCDDADLYPEYYNSKDNISHSTHGRGHDWG